MSLAQGHATDDDPAGGAVPRSAKAWLKPLPVAIAVTGVLLLIPFFGPMRVVAIAAIALGSCIGIWLSFALHELGHLVAGKGVGFRLSLFIVSPFVILRTQGPLSLSGNDSWLLPGLTVMIPTHLQRLRQRVGWMIAGGPLANLLALVLIGGLLWVIGSSDIDKDLLRETVFQYRFRTWVVMLAGMGVIQCGIACLGLVIGNLWPHRARKTGALSDGGRIRMLLQGGADADRWISLFMLMNRSMTGQRPRAWDTQWIQPAATLTDQTIDSWQACYWGYMWALDRGEVELAGTYLAQLETQGADIPRLSPLAAAEAAFFEARHRGNLARARERLSHAASSPEEPRLRAQAAIHVAEGQWTEARESASAALRMLAANSSPVEAGTNVAKLEWIKTLTAQAQRQHA